MPVDKICAGRPFDPDTFMRHRKAVTKAAGLAVTRCAMGCHAGRRVEADEGVRGEVQPGGHLRGEVNHDPRVPAPPVPGAGGYGGKRT